MSTSTRIEWTDTTWNPVTGCDKVSAGCEHCYAETIANRFAGTAAFPNGFAVTLHPDRLAQPLRWRRPRMVFVNSMSDLFHTQVPTEFIAKVFAVMATAEKHIFQVLTKRPGRMRSLLTNPAFINTVATDQGELAGRLDQPGWPLPNVWLGVSVETQHWAQVRLPALAETPAAVRFVSCEPLLGPVDLTTWLTDSPGLGLDWVIVGGESGPHARPIQLGWVQDLRDQCHHAPTRPAFFFKQWGGHTPKAGGRHLDGLLWDQLPATATAPRTVTQPVT